VTPRQLTQVPNGCWIACIAGLTDLDHDELAALIPAAVKDAGTKVETDAFRSAFTDYHNAVNRFMRGRGWRLAYVGMDIPRGFSIGCGKSPRGVDHAVIALDGVVWWDPHPSRQGVERITSYEVIVPILGQVPRDRSCEMITAETGFRGEDGG
jgi:hypothetical protein